MDFYKLKCRYDETRQYKDRWLGLYKDLYFYVIPDRDAFNVKWNYRDDGKPTTVQVWDNTAVLAAYQRANDLHGLLLPKDRIWGKLILDPHLFSKEEIEFAKPVIDEINDRIFFYLNESNLSRVVSSSNLDLVGGTGAIWVESISDDVPLYFRSIPSVALYIEYANDDVLNTCWYQCKMSGRQVLDTFPDYRGSRYSNFIQEPDSLQAVIYGQIKMPGDKFYIYAILEEDPFTPLWERDSNYPQILIFRDRVRPGESDGRGIGCDMLPAIRDLNRIVEYDRKSLAFKAYPPMYYDSNTYFNPYSVRQWAGAMIARAPNARNPIEPMQMPNNSDVLPSIQHLQETIMRGFQVDPLGELTSPVRSATEVSIRENRAQRTSATDISRLINELPKQIYEVAGKILSERRLLDKNRRFALNDGARKLKFQFESPLYDLQKQDDLNHFITNMQVKQQFFGQQAAMATVNMFEVNEFLTNNLNLKSKLFKNQRELQDVINNIAQAQQNAALPTPSTTAARVDFPGRPQVTI
jgi:Bacteriophage head to tail connecting protein